MSNTEVESTNNQELTGGNNSEELPGAESNKESYAAFGGEGNAEEIEMEDESEEFVGGKRRRRRSSRSRKNSKSQRKSKRSKSQKKQKKQQKSRKNRSQKRGGKRTGIVETAAVPFGLLALQHYASKKVGRKSRKSRRSRKN